ncbi:hypothetical protein F4821DRAFT_222375 [Hypoxylon rubiginosum]|uniref:Uncharacterized protein n=1 Tax=Hypoxylon rubiginosum TaxID=110542 RepID=A0ACC0DKR8_9PEZI|nr:hypothetical protein F4821DRAFT_222375 [Hypoxylon rubiginosum]
MSEDDSRHFPESIRSYLFGFKGDCKSNRGYNRAYRLMCGDSQASLDCPYPVDKSVAEEHLDYFEKIRLKLRERISTRFDYCPTAAQFTHRAPHECMYRMTKGGFSTVNWILDQIYNKSENIHVLSETQVMTVDSDKMVQIGNACEDTGNTKCVRSLVVRDNSGNRRVISTGNATVILSAGTIDTATIALRSGIGNDNKYVGAGLTDHEIWGTRLEYIVVPERPEALQPLRLQSWIYFERKDGNNHTRKQICLLSITINAQSFLGECKLPTQCCGKDGKIKSRPEYEKELEDELQKGTNARRSSIQILFIFKAELGDKNRVLNLPESVPTIQITSREHNFELVPQMREVAQTIREVIEQMMGLYNDGQERHEPELTRADFGVVAHEVGTMRIKKSREEVGVVDEDLRVGGWGNLYVCDLSVFPVSPAANPSLTLAALAQRLGDHLLAQRTTPLPFR